MKRALELGPTALILVHNYPKGDSAPTRADINMTKHGAIPAAAPFNIIVRDHLIVSPEGVTSFKSPRLM